VVNCQVFYPVEQLEFYAEIFDSVFRARIITERESFDSITSVKTAASASLMELIMISEFIV